MPTQAMKQLTPKELARLSWAEQQAYAAQHGPRPSNEFKVFTDAKAAVSGLLAVTTAYAIQFGGMCECTESVAWAGKAMTSASNATDRIREAETPADMVKAVEAFVKEIAVDRIDNHASNAIEGALKEVVARAKVVAKGLPKTIAPPAVPLKGQPARGGPPIGGGAPAPEPEPEPEPEKDKDKK